MEVRAVLCAFQAVEKVFAVPEGFYWQTVESDDKRFPDSSATEACRDTDTEVKNNKHPLLPHLEAGGGGGHWETIKCPAIFQSRGLILILKYFALSPKYIS